MLAALTRQCRAAYRVRRSSMVRSTKPQQPVALDVPLRKLAPRQDSNGMTPSSTNTVGDSRLQPATSSTPQSIKENRFSYTERELNLVMYYMDHLFPRLCPFYKYSPIDDGRGWLLNLFLRTKPLCTLAVCISECDKAQLVLGPLSDTPQPHLKLEEQHMQIIADLRDHLRLLAESDGPDRMSAIVEALACIMHLVLFEVC